ncbi:MAG: DUF1493 family protein [Saprospiraceae bacterium]
MPTLQEILEFVKKQTGVREVHPESDIQLELGIDGDDFEELIVNYSDKFDVDISKFLWYFHFWEEGQNLGGIFFAPPNKRVTRIPVTPIMLLKFSNSGNWDLKYPDHVLPSKRYDLIFNRIIGIVVIIGFFLVLFLKYWK